MPEGIRISQITAGHAKEFHETAAGAWHPSSGRVPSSLFPGQPSRAAPVRKRRNTPAKGSFRGQSTLWEQVKIPKDAAPAPVVEMLPDGNTPAKVTPFTQHPRLSQSRHATYQMLCPHFASPCNLDGLILADSNWEHLGDQFRWWRCADQPAIFWHP